MRSKRELAAPAVEFRGMGLEVGQRDGREEAEAAGEGPDLAFIRPPRRTGFAEGEVVTLQHWLDLNA